MIINELLMCRRTLGYGNGSKWSHFQESMVYCVHECFMFEHSHRTSNQPTSSNIGIWTNIIWRTLFHETLELGFPMSYLLDYKYLWLSHSFERYESHGGPIIPSNKSEQNMPRVAVWWAGEMIQDVNKNDIYQHSKCYHLVICYIAMEHHHLNRYIICLNGSVSIAM